MGDMIAENIGCT